MTGPQDSHGRGRRCPPRPPARAAPPPSRTLSRPMWMRSLVRKALELKEDELKAFFIKASAGQRRQGQGAYCTGVLATG